MRVLIWLFVFCFIFKGNWCKVNFTVGGFFHDDNYDVEMAFKYGIDRHNMYNTEVYFNANIVRLNKNDLFAASKIACDITAADDGVVGIFGPESLKVSAMIQSVCGNLEIPHIQVSWKATSSHNNKIALNFYPRSDLLASGLATVVRHMKWKNYVILYQHNEGLIRLEEVMKIPQLNDNPVTIKQLDKSGDHRILLKTLKMRRLYNILLDCDTSEIPNVLQQAQEVGLHSMYYSLLLTSLDAHTIDYSAYENSNGNITTISIIDPFSVGISNMVNDWRAGEERDQKDMTIKPHQVRTEAALMHDAVNLFMLCFDELHVTRIESRALKCDGLRVWDGGFRIASYMKIRQAYNPLSGIIQFDEDGRRNNFTLYVGEVSRGKIVKTAQWYPYYGDWLNITRNATEQQEQMYRRFQQNLLIVASRLGPPYLDERKPSYPGEILEGNARYEGYSMDLIAALAKEVNFTFLFQINSGYGKYNEITKEWDGLIREILTGRAQLAICDLTITHQRREAVDFSMPFMTLGISILYRKAKPEDRNIFAFMEPLETEVWIYIATAYIGLTVILYFISRMAPGDWENPHPCDQEPTELENIWTLKNCLWLLLGSTMSQGSDILPKGISSRMGVSMWWFLILIINSSYTANLAAFLTMERMGPNIDSAEALAKQSKIKYGLMAGGATETYFKNSNYSTYEKMWLQMQSSVPSVFEENNADGVKRVLTTKHQLYAFLMESSSIEYEVAKNCELKQVGGKLDLKSYGIAMPFNAPYRSQINSALLKMQESGELNRLKAKWWTIPGKKCEDSVEEVTNANELALDNVGGAFVVLGVGVGIAFGFALIEFLWNVREVSVEEHISYWEALLIEIKFAINIWVTKKRVKPEISEKSSDNGSETRSIAQKVLHGAGSFLHLDVFDKISMNKSMQSK